MLKLAASSEQQKTTTRKIIGTHSLSLKQGKGLEAPTHDMSYVLKATLSEIVGWTYSFVISRAPSMTIHVLRSQLVQAPFRSMSLRLKALDPANLVPV